MLQKELCPAKVKKDDATGTEVDTNYSLFTEPNIAYLSGTNVSYQYGLNNKPYPQMVDPIAGFSPDGVSAAIVTNIIRKGVEAERNLVNTGRYNMPTDMIDRGWAGAGLWYNKIAAANGAIAGAAQSTPRIVAYPELMEAIVRAKLLNNKNIAAGTMFSPEKGQDGSMAAKRAGETKAVMPLQRIYADWSNVADSYKPDTGNMIYDFINKLFGTQGLFDLRDPGNQGVHPLAQMTSMGKSLIEASIRNLGLAVGGNVAGGALASATEGLTISTSVASSFLFTIVTMTLGAGIILYYVLPFMPFVYFFFAVGSWIKEVFEAMVGVPLWALAHLRIDGDGLPGEAARSGYFMIFEIFLRPIMIVFGLIAAVSIFASMATVLNTVFNIAVVNAGGTNYANMGMTSVTEFARGPLDQLFYTILYAVLMYIIAMSSFKMIDLIPNQIMRWLGVSVSAFAAQTGDSAQNLMGNIQQQGLGKVDQAVGGLREGSKGVGDTLGKVAK